MAEIKELSKEDLERDILDIVARCIRCRFCVPSCPLFDITRGWVTQGASGITQALYYAIKWGLEGKDKENLRSVLYSCTTCRNCVQTCKKMSAGVDLLDAITKGRQLLIEEMIGPMPEQKRALESLLRYGNPYGKLAADRTKWAKGLDVPLFSQDANLDVLYYVGCTAAYDDRVQAVARAIVRLFNKAGVRFGILAEEACCGSPAHTMGEQWLFQELATRNRDQFESLGVKQIVTISPHCYDTLVNLYPEEVTPKIDTKHYTQFILELIESGRLSFTHRLKKKVTYQDPCYLGRHNDIYEAPRKVLKSLPGIELIEMTRCREEGLCCGGGGGRMWTDFSQEEARLGDIRVKEALATGAEILVTACPYCLINMEDAVKAVGVEDRLKIMDLAELLLDATGE